jgi:hypothetical protein
LEHAAPHPDGDEVLVDLDGLPNGVPARIEKCEEHATGLSRAGPRRKQLVGIVDPHKRDAVLIGAVHGEPKIRLYRVAEPALVDHRSALGKAPAPESAIGLGRAPADFELDIPRARRLFSPFDDCNHSQLSIPMLWE